MKFEQLSTKMKEGIVTELGLNGNTHLENLMENEGLLVFERGDDLCDYLSRCMPSYAFSVIGIEGVWIIDERDA